MEQHLVPIFIRMDNMAAWFYYVAWNDKLGNFARRVQSHDLSQMKEGQDEQAYIQ